MSEDELRTARLLFDAELASGALASGTLSPAALAAPSLARIARVRRVPPRALRVAEQLRYKLGRLDYETAVLAGLARARRELLGDGAAAAPPRFLVRVDEFPHVRAWDPHGPFGTAAFARFHEAMADAGVPYLLAVPPRVSDEPFAPAARGSRPLRDEELALLGRVLAERVTPALHGRDHRTRFRSPRRRSELCGLDDAQTQELLEDALAELAAHGLRPDAFVPPYNRFDARQYTALARRFRIVCAGPEAIGTMGFHATPQWRGEAVYLPSYRPVYGRAADVLPAVERMIERGAGAWVPLVLHWGWELADELEALRTLARRVAPHAVHWHEFLAAVERSREVASPRDFR